MKTVRNRVEVHWGTGKRDGVGFVGIIDYYMECKDAYACRYHGKIDRPIQFTVQGNRVSTYCWCVLLAGRDYCYVRRDDEEMS